MTPVPGGPATGPATGPADGPADGPGVDPDVTAADLRDRRESFREQAPVLAAVSLGGVLGASARYGAGLVWPSRPTGFPWTTFGINVLGCLLMGVLITLISDRPTLGRLVRPFLGTGVLGGFTTFSTYAVDIRRLVELGQVPTAIAYLAGTLTAATAAAWAGATVVRRARPRPGPPPTAAPVGTAGTAGATP